MEIVIVIAVLLFVVSVVLAYYLFKVGRDFGSYKKGELERLKKAGEQAIEKSRGVLGGKFTEQMAPYLPEFQYDPTEARFIGSPIDLLVFPGLAEGEPREVVLIEVKSGEVARLTPKERKIQKLVEAGNVRWELIHRPPSSS